MRCAKPNRKLYLLYDYTDIKCENAWIETSDESEQVRMSKIQTWENHEFRRCYCTPAWYWRNSFVDVGFMWAGNRCSRGTQGIRQSRWFWPSRESWICGTLDLYDFCATKMCYQLRQQCHGSWDGSKAEINLSSFDMLMRMSCDSVSIAHISSSYAVKFPWWDSAKMLQILQESHVQKVQRTHWQALCCLCQWHLGSKRKREKKSIPNHPWGLRCKLAVRNFRGCKLVNFPLFGNQTWNFLPFLMHKTTEVVHI